MSCNAEDRKANDAYRALERRIKVLEEKLQVVMDVFSRTLELLGGVT